MKYLLDTNVLSEPLRTRPDARVLEKLHAHPRDLCTTTIVWHELLYGAARLPDGARRAHIERYLADVVGATVPVLPYDANAAAWHAEERARLEKIGKTPPFVDGMIAAVAKVNGLVVVTDNISDFKGFDLVVERWHARGP